MSSAYTYARSQYGNPCPAGVSQQSWRRIQQVARDTRLRLVDPALLPDSYSALYELTKLPTGMLTVSVNVALMRPDLSCREVRAWRAKGKLPMTVTIWTDPGEYGDLVDRIERIRDEFGRSERAGGRRRVASGMMVGQRCPCVCDGVSG